MTEEEKMNKKFWRRIKIEACIILLIYLGGVIIYLVELIF